MSDELVETIGRHLEVMQVEEALITCCSNQLTMLQNQINLIPMYSLSLDNRHVIFILHYHNAHIILINTLLIFKLNMSIRLTTSLITLFCNVSELEEKHILENYF